MEIDLETLTRAIRDSWDADTASEASDWSLENKARGQCVPTVLVVQDYMGGELEKLLTVLDGKEESHYRNRLDDGTIVDITREQYPEDQKLQLAQVDLKGAMSVREKRLSDSDTHERYIRLRDRVDQILDPFN